MYIIKGFWGEEPAYYIGISPSKLGDLTCVNLSTSIEKATKFNNIDDAIECFSIIDPTLFKVYPVCPVCNKDYDEHPAISRKDNKTKICSECGIKEALDDWRKNI